MHLIENYLRPLCFALGSLVVKIHSLLGQPLFLSKGGCSGGEKVIFSIHLGPSFQYQGIKVKPEFTLCYCLPVNDL